MHADVPPSTCRRNSLDAPRPFLRPPGGERHQQIRRGSAPLTIRCATRCASVLVLPEPAPAMISNGPPGAASEPCSTARNWASFNSTLFALMRAPIERSFDINRHCFGGRACGQFRSFPADDAAPHGSRKLLIALVSNARQAYAVAATGFFVGRPVTKRSQGSEASLPRPLFALAET